MNRIESNRIESNQTDLWVYCCEKNCMCIEYSRIPMLLFHHHHHHHHHHRLRRFRRFCFLILMSFFFYYYLISNCREKRLILWEELYVESELDRPPFEMDTFVYVYWRWQDAHRNVCTYVSLRLRPLNAFFVRSWSNIDRGVGVGVASIPPKAITLAPMFHWADTIYPISSHITLTPNRIYFLIVFLLLLLLVMRYYTLTTSPHRITEQIQIETAWFRVL